MSVLKSWTGGAVVLLALAGGLRAEVTVSQSNEPTRAVVPVDQGLLALLGQERSALGAVPAGRLTAITTAPVAARKEAKGDAAVTPIAYSEEWVDTQPAATGDAQFQCLAKALYFEARGEEVAGQAAVAEVILNRVDDPAFPGSICGVVQQSNGRGCQFSYICDGRADRISEKATYERVAKVARAMLDGAPRQLTAGATYFHTPAVRPTWSHRFTRTAQIGHHIFYRGLDGSAEYQLASN